MNLSLNEVEATARKAARGVGYDWGLCEEAGRAARWLCSFGLDGCGALARQLRLADGTDLRAAAPEIGVDVWRARAGNMCPLFAGAAVSDFAFRLEAEAMVLESVMTPILLLPFAGAAARRTGAALAIEWQGFAAVASGPELGLGTGLLSGYATRAERAKISAGGKVARSLRRVTRAGPDPSDWLALERFARRTYAPATAESRLLGAGAGLSDND